MRTKMKRAARAFLCGGLAMAMPIHAAPAARSAQDIARPRLIVLTDIGNEPDDSESMVRLLTYANEMQIEGLVASTSRHLPTGPNKGMIEERLAAYGQSLTNLKIHDNRYPSVERLRAVTLSGSAVYGMLGVGPGKDSAASRLIIEAVDRPDPRPLWIAIWGGAADLAQALWTVRATRTQAELDRFVAKLRVYSISDQDDAGPWARAYFPKLFWVANIHGFTRYRLATWTGISAPAPGADPEPVSKAWLSANIVAKGPLGASYPLPAYIMEGDTPSFLNLISNGLSVQERPDWGGWGGRYERLSTDLGLWTTTADTVVGADGTSHSTPQATVWRWRAAFQNDFAARMAWSVSPRYADANHAPTVMVNGQEGLAPVEMTGCAGVPVSLSAIGSRDPDGDALTYRWFWYREATGLFAPDVMLSTQTGTETKVEVGKTVQLDQFTPPSTYKIHVILEVQDSGTPKLTRYRRAIITVPGANHGDKGNPCAVTPNPPGH